MFSGASLVSNMRRHFKNSSDANAESTIVGGAIVKAQSEPPKPGAGLGP